MRDPCATGSWVFPLWPNHKEGLGLVGAALLFGGLDTLIYTFNPPTTGWAGQHAALLLQLTVDVALLFLLRFPKTVACLALLVAVLMLASEQFAAGLLVPVDPATRLTVPLATPAIACNLVRLLDLRTAFVLIGLLAALGSRFWEPSWAVTPFGLLNTVLPAVAVLYLDARRQLVASLRDRAERAEREQNLLAERARAQERRQLAGEMHDIVTHRLSLMVLRAGTLPAISRESAVHAAATDIRESGTKALDELRDLVGVLRSGGPAMDGSPTGTGGERRPAPDPAELVTQARAAGEQVSLTVDGDPGLVSAAVGRTGYRIVQEALTNARKHAPGGEVRVCLSYAEDGMRVEVRNGPARDGADELLAGSGSGSGLLGLRQRVELVGGQLDPAPMPGGGYRLSAILPAYVPTQESDQHDSGGRRR